MAISSYTELLARRYEGQLDAHADRYIGYVPVVQGDRARPDQYEQFASAYIVKRVDFAQFLDVVRSIEGFWLTVVTYPEK